MWMRRRYGVVGYGGKRVKKMECRERRGGEGKWRREEAIGDEETKEAELVEEDEELEQKQQKCEK